MTDRKFKPGHRGFGLRGRNDRISDQRIAWGESSRVKVYLMRYQSIDEMEDRDPEPDIEMGANFVLVITRPGRKPLILNLGSFTEKELVVFREIIDLSIDLALPVAIARDRAAKEAQDAGDDSLVRNYRPLPFVLKRKGAFGADGKSVLNGLEDLPAGLGVGLGVPPPPGRVPGAGPGVAGDEPVEAGTEDDTTPSN